MTAGPIAAQQPFVPQEFYSRTRPDFGQALPLCIMPNSATPERDRAVARSIPELLLQESRVVEIEVDMDQLGAEGIWPTVFVYLAETCVGVLGVQLVPGIMVPEWLTITRPYYEAPYVMVSREDGIRSLADLPADARLGSPLNSAIDNELLRLIDAGGAFADISRFPYDDPSLAAQLLRDGVLDAAIVWKPHLEEPAFEQGDVYSGVGAVAPLKNNTRQLGIVLRARDEALRVLLDDAIAALDAQQ